MTDQSEITGRAVGRLEAGADIRAIVPTTIDATFRLAELIFASGLAPDGLKNAAAVTVVFLKGLEIGLPPMAALECIGIINGKACLHSDGIPSLLWSRGFKIKEWYENDDNPLTRVAHCQITRPDGTEHMFKYSAQDAIENGLWNGKVNDGGKTPWARYTKRMLRMRCRGWLARDCAADVLKGIPLYDEQADIALDRSEYREVKPGALAVPDDIPSDDEPPAKPTVSEAEDNQDSTITNIPLYLERLEEQLAAAEDMQTLDEVWASHEETSDGCLGRDDAEKAEGLYDRYGKRFA